MNEQREVSTRFANGSRNIHSHGYSLKQCVIGRSIRVHKFAIPGIPTHAVQCHHRRLYTDAPHKLRHVTNRALDFRMSRTPCAMDMLKPGLSPGPHQRFFQFIELFVLRHRFNQPALLNHGSFNQRKRGFGVVLQKLGAALGIEQKIKPSM